jgi:hypothetical protein
VRRALHRSGRCLMMEMSVRSTILTLASSLRAAVRSPIAWLLACVHGLWFFLAIANMSSPSPGLGEFLDRGGLSSATLLAGRPFHFHYESLALKILVLVDAPGAFAALPLSVLVAPICKLLRFGSFAGSYVAAALILLGASCQWLLVGGKAEHYLERRSPTVRSWLDRWSYAAIVVIVLATVVLTPTINARSKAAGFKHGGISFR